MVIGNSLHFNSLHTYNEMYSSTKKVFLNFKLLHTALLRVSDSANLKCRPYLRWEVNFMLFISKKYQGRCSCEISYGPEV